MKRIVIRKKVITGVQSNFVLKFGDQYDSIEGVIRDYGIGFTLKNIFCEEDITFDDLLKEYNEFIKCDTSELFSHLYLIDDEFGVAIDDNIYLYRLNSKVNCELCKYTQWTYAEGKKYIGDPWWFDDDEIIEDITNLNLIEFTRKYKGF